MSRGLAALQAVAMRRALVLMVLVVVGATSFALVNVDADRADAHTLCGSRSSPPHTYRHVVVIMEENRTWPRVGGPGFTAMPYLHGVASECTFYTNWNETNPSQNSLTQYIGLTSGVDNPTTVNDCSPIVCHSTANNIFRQVRDSGGTARTYVEDASGGCAPGGHPPNVPALYYYGANDHSFCTREVRPFKEFDPNRLPTFAMIIPSRCHNGHNCSNLTVDTWLRAHLTSILRGKSYRAHQTAVFVLYDEDRPVPNLIIAPTAHEGALTKPVGSHAEALRTIEQMLGLPILPAVRHVVSLRASAHI